MIWAQCPNPIKVEIKLKDPVCHGSNRGSATGVITGGNPPYAVILTGAANAKLNINFEGGSFLFGGIALGDYTLTVTDTNFPGSTGCSFSESFAIIAPPELILEISGESASCSGETDGKLKGTISGGTPPYTLLLNGATITPTKTTITNSGIDFEIDGLGTGSYFVRVIDANYDTSGNADGCTTSNTAIVTSSNTGGGTIETRLDIEICEGQSYEFGTRELTTSGIYRETFASSTGCDSTVILNLSTKTIESVVDVEICEGQPYQLGTQTLTTGGTYRETFTTNTGCDSTVILNLSTKTIESFVDVEICEGQSYQLGTQTLSAGGTYSETFTTSMGCDSIVTVNLSIKAGEAFGLITAPMEKTLCVEETVPISVGILGGVPAYQIRWYDNLDGTGTPIGVSETILVNPDVGFNTYLVKVSDADGCMVVGTSAITLLPVDATIDPIEQSVCDDTEELVLTVINNDSRQKLNYQWQPENAIITSPSAPEVVVDLTNTTNFFVQVTNQEGCEAVLTSTINKDVCGELMISADSPTVIPGGSAILTVTGCTDCEFLWSSGQTDSTITVTPSLTTAYSVSITTPAGCDCNTLEQMVEVNDCIINPEDFYIPTAFTPDGDQINDELCVRSELERVPPDAVEILLIIYNRWGQELFRGTSFGDCWDGTFQGGPVAPDVYAYHLQVMCPGNTFTKKGDVMILR